MGLISAETPVFAPVASIVPRASRLSPRRRTPRGTTATVRQRRRCAPPADRRRHRICQLCLPPANHQLHEPAAYGRHADIFGVSDLRECIAVGRAGQIDAGPHNVRDAGANLGKRLTDDLQAPPSLSAGVGIQLPSGQIGAVPKTNTRRPTRTARVMPIRGSQGEPENTWLCSTRQLVPHRADRRRHR
jgi:hypothetical protein